MELPRPFACGSPPDRAFLASSAFFASSVDLPLLAAPLAGASSATPTCAAYSAYSYVSDDDEMVWRQTNLATDMTKAELKGGSRVGYRVQGRTQRLTLRAPTSLVPSPHMRVVYPTARRVLRTTSFCSGDVRANTYGHVSEQLSAKPRWASDGEHHFRCWAPTAH